MGMASTSKIRKPPGEGELAEKRAARRVSSGPRPFWKQEVRAKHREAGYYFYYYLLRVYLRLCHGSFVHRRQSSLREAVYAVSHAQSCVGDAVWRAA